MTRHMIKCVKDDRLKHESDHLSIITEFFMNSILQIVQKKQSWKKMNKKRIAAEAQHLQQSDSLNISENIEDYIDYLFRFMKNLMNLTVL